MAINMKPVDIVGFSIFESVGLNGRNQPDDIFTIKTLLNGIAPDDGGADGTLDVKVLTNSDNDMEPVIDAIIVFQQKQPGLLHDGRVDPEKHTIKRMRLLFNRRKGGGLDLGVTVVPDGPIFGPCDAQGFSAAKLRSTNGVWSSFDGSAPIRQMVPLPRTRKLRVRGINGAAVSFVLDSPKAEIVDRSNDSVTVKGLAEGEADLIIRVEGQRSATTVRLMMRRPAQLPIDIFHLGRAPLADATMIATQRAIVTTVSSIYQNQANLTFTSGTSQIVDAVMTDGRMVPIDPNKTLLIRHGFAFGPPAAQQDIKFDDLKSLVTNPKAVSVFISAKILDDKSDTVDGAGAINGRILWMNPFRFPVINKVSILAAHEIGHSLGMHHITTSNNASFLMNPSSTNFIIPSETLIELKP